MVLEDEGVQKTKRQYVTDGRSQIGLIFLTSESPKTLSRHQHTGPVYALTLEGTWYHFEHEWWANENGFSMEPSGETHTLVVPENVDEMSTLFHIVGVYVYVNEQGKAERGGYVQEDQDGEALLRESRIREGFCELVHQVSIGRGLALSRLKLNIKRPKRM